MKTKHILALVTFVAAFVFSTSLVALFFPKAISQTRNVVFNKGCKSNTAHRITQLLQKDISNGSDRMDLDENRRSLAVRTEKYVSASENLSYEDLPLDFQAAWQNHIRAWRKQANLYNTLDSDDFEDVELERMSSRNTDEINRTWFKVLHIARQHGAMIPAGAY